MDGLISLPESISGGIGKEGRIDKNDEFIKPESVSGGTGEEGLDGELDENSDSSSTSFWTLINVLNHPSNIFEVKDKLW